jgi:tetratricopeptide (TPR) repeat protein
VFSGGTVPFAAFFAEQLRDLENFLAISTGNVRVVRVDPEMRGLFLRMLTRRDESADFPHILVGHYDDFQDPVSWFDGLEAAVRTEISRAGGALAARGIRIAEVPSDARTTSPWRFLKLVESLADGLPDDAGSLAFLLAPDQIKDPDSFVRSIEFLASRANSRWLRFIVLEDRAAPLLTDLAATHPKVTSQTFWLPPDRVARRQEAKNGFAALSPSPPLADNRIAAAVAFANKDYARTEALQREQLQQPAEAKAPVQQVIEQYNLGRTLLEAGQAEEAVSVLAGACDMACTHGLNEIMPTVYMNLGMALHRVADFDQAFKALQVANRFFKTQGNLPGEAFSYDTLAGIYDELGRQEEAERTWRYALAVYDSITNPDLGDVRAAGRTDIQAKLARLEKGRLGGGPDGQPAQ